MYIKVLNIIFVVLVKNCIVAFFDVRSVRAKKAHWGKSCGHSFCLHLNQPTPSISQEEMLY